MYQPQLKAFSATKVDYMFRHVSLPSDIYSLTQTVMAMFLSGESKGQKTVSLSMIPMPATKSELIQIIVITNNFRFSQATQETN